MSIRFSIKCGSASGPDAEPFTLQRRTTILGCILTKPNGRIDDAGVPSNVQVGLGINRKDNEDEKQSQMHKTFEHVRLCPAECD
jgi:hypothetical protein